MKVINMLGAPGAGKSTTAAALFALMKYAGMNVELVSEYAKDIVWEERDTLWGSQDYIFAKQHRRLTRLEGKVDYVITDCPLILSKFYSPEDTPVEFTKYVEICFNRFDNYIVFVDRVKKYNPIGRNQDEAGSDKVRVDLIAMMTGLIDIHVDGDKFAAGRIFSELGFAE